MIIIGLLAIAKRRVDAQVAAPPDVTDATDAIDPTDAIGDARDG